MASGLLPIQFSTVLRNPSIVNPLRFPELRVPLEGDAEIRPLPDNTGAVYILTDPSGQKAGAATVRLRPTDLPLPFVEENFVNRFLAVDNANDGVQLVVRRRGTVYAPPQSSSGGGSGGGGGFGGGGGGSRGSGSTGGHTPAFPA